MEIAGATNYRHHRRSPSSDRFLELFTPTGSPNTTPAGGDSALTSNDDDELNEAEVVWNGGGTDSTANTESNCNTIDQKNRRILGFRQPEKSGILAALSDENNRNGILPNRPVLSRRNSISPSSSSGISSNSASRLIPSIPKPPLQINNNILQDRDYTRTQSVPSRSRYQQQQAGSAPMKVPVLSKAMMKERRRAFNGIDVADDDEDDEDDEMLPPHEIVAMQLKSTNSVLEGVGRTLKGRDLRQVRNAVFRQTGFLD